MKLAHIWSDFQDEIGGLFKVSLLGRIGIEPEIAQCRGKNIIGGIQHVNAAIPELRQVLRFEDDVPTVDARSEEHTSELQSHLNLVCRLLLEKKKNKSIQ